MLKKKTSVEPEDWRLLRLQYARLWPLFFTIITLILLYVFPDLVSDSGRVLGDKLQEVFQ